MYRKKAQNIQRYSGARRNMSSHDENSTQSHLVFSCTDECVVNVSGPKEKNITEGVSFTNILPRFSLKNVNVTALFTNMRTLKFKSRLRNCVFRCRQS